MPNYKILPGPHAITFKQDWIGPDKELYKGVYGTFHIYGDPGNRMIGTYPDHKFEFPISMVQNYEPAATCPTITRNLVTPELFGESVTEKQKIFTHYDIDNPQKKVQKV